MATSDVLQFRYHIENEIAQNATKNFAGMLGKVFEQYKKLWIEYLNLRTYCENADLKIPFQLFDPTSDNHDIAILSQAAEGCTDLSNDIASQMSPNHSKSSSLYKNLSACNLGNVLTEGETVLADDKFVDEKQIVENDLLHSPVLIKQRKSKKNCFTPDLAIMDDSDVHTALVKENMAIVQDSSDENLSETSVENDENQFPSMLNNNDQIECTPLSKLPKRLGVSKLYNVDTTLLSNGKKLKQSRLAFLPTSESKGIIDQKSHKKLTPLVRRDIFDYRQDIDEEIIEGSPAKRIKSISRMKRCKPNEKNPAKLGEDSCRKKILFGKCRDNKIASLSQHLSVHTSTQKDELYPIRKLKSFSISDNGSIRSNNDISPSCSSPIMSDIKPKLETENVVTSSASQTQRRKSSKLLDETCGYNSSCGDETFCLLGEKLKEKSTSIVGSTENNKNKLTKNVSRKCEEKENVKKSLMNSFDMVPEKEDVFIGKTKNRIERAKMAGTTCWECEKYYGNLGLSDEELKARQKLCSRHRTEYNEKPSTPEGFWDPLFPDTYSSTFQDD